MKGVLPQVLDEILATRAMLKRAKKAYKAHGGGRVPSGVYRQLEARQLALKLIANVTYGYTSATFSGRCCCPPVAGESEFHRTVTQRNATQRNATQRNATQRNTTQHNTTQQNSTG